MAKASRGLTIAYNVIAVVFAIMLGFSATLKLMLHPGPVKGIHEVVGVPLSWFPVLAACLIAGAVGLVVGIFRPKIGVAAAGGLVVYFIGAIVAHVLANDWAGLKGPIVPFLLATTALTLRILSQRRASAAA
jgi:hypothetical protein